MYLCDVSLPFGTSWGADNQIVFARHGILGFQGFLPTGVSPRR